MTLHFAVYIYPISYSALNVMGAQLLMSDLAAVTSLY